MTYSIVARDPDTGDLGVAVQSRAFNTGAVVPWGAPGVGVVATQSYTELSYGPLGLELLRAGKSPEKALAELVAADEEPEYRQVAILDTEGRVAVHVGEACIPAAAFAIAAVHDLDRTLARIFGATATGQVAEARALLQPLLESEPRWADFIRTLADRELLPHAA
jgi:hypothetical protein